MIGMIPKCYLKCCNAPILFKALHLFFPTAARLAGCFYGRKPRGDWLRLQFHHGFAGADSLPKKTGEK